MLNGLDSQFVKKFIDESFLRLLRVSDTSGELLLHTYLLQELLLYFVNVWSHSEVILQGLVDHGKTCLVGGSRGGD